MQLDDTTVLALGTTGAQGSGLVEALVRRGARPVRVTSDPTRADAWRSAGEAAAAADLTDPRSLVEAAAATGARAAVLHIPLGLGSAEGAAAVVASVAALRAEGLAVAVNAGGPVPAEGAPDPAGRRGLVEALTGTGAAVVAPTAYLENHLAPWATGRITDGELVYPRPADDVVAWVSARDVTAGAVAALANDRGGDVVPLPGPTPLTFAELAEEVGTGLDRPLVFREVTPGEYGRMLEPYLGAAAAAGVEAFYASMPRTPDPSLSRAAGDVWDGLGLVPMTARQWSADVLAPALSAVRR